MATKFIQKCKTKIHNSKSKVLVGCTISGFCFGSIIASGSVKKMNAHSFKYLPTEEKITYAISMITLNSILGYGTGHLFLLHPEVTICCIALIAFCHVGTPKPHVNVWFSEVLFHISYGKFLSQRLKNARKNIENACIFNVFTER